MVMDYRLAAEQMAAECLCFRARRVSRVLTRIYDEELRPLGIQATQLTLLNAVAIGGEAGARMNRLAEILAMDATTLSRNLRPLARQGLLRIERSTRDRRVRIARLTHAGRDRVARALPLWRRAQERIEQALGAALASDLRTRMDAAVEAGAGSEVSLPVPARTGTGD